MSMEITNNYSKYEVNSADKTTAGGKVSETTQDYLEELKQKYPSVNISVVDFKSDKQKLSYMMGSSGLQNLAISSNILGKMAKDPEAAAKYESLIAKIPEDAKETQKYFDDRNLNIYGSGMIIDRDGKVSYWAVGGDKEPRENPGSAYKKQQQERLEEKRAEKKKQEVVEEKKTEAKKQAEILQEKRVAIAKTNEEMFEKMSGGAGNPTAARSKEDGKGEKIDLSV